MTEDVEKTLDEVATENAVSTEAEQEIMVPQSKVNEIVGRVKREAAERARREYMQQLEQEQAQSQQEPQQAQQAAPAVDQEALFEQFKERLMREEAERRAQAEEEQTQAELMRVANSYLSKMGKGSELFEDFEETMKEFNPREFRHLVFLAADLDDTASVMYELNKNPKLLAEMANMARETPQFARAQLKELEKSIHNNRQALQQKPKVNQPLSRVKPSLPAGADNGELTIKDFKSKYRG